MTTTPNTKHTPGPWTISRLQGRTSFRLYHPDTTSEYQARANARLIAASPDLLEALQALLPYAEKLLEAAGAIDGLVDSKVNVEYDIEQARAAIAKAA